MLNFFRKSASPPLPSNAAMIAAIPKVLTIIRFNPDGTIRDANDLFLKATGHDRAKQPLPAPALRRAG